MHPTCPYCKKNHDPRIGCPEYRDRQNREAVEADLSPQTEQAEASSLSDLVIPLEDWDKLYWAYNLPVQMWKGDDGYRVLNYMPRKERMITLDKSVSKEDLPQFCKNAANILRNLAELFEAMGRGEVETIYYPNETVEEAKTKAV